MYFNKVNYKNRMQVHALEIDEFSDDNYILIAVHTTLEEFQLAYFLNQKLYTKFKRSKYNLDFENKNNNASFSIYEYRNTKFSHDWFLIKNQFINESTTSTKGLFKTDEITTYLIPEKKKVDFFLKLEGDLESQFIVKIIDSINSINQVITSYIIDANTLKSKDFLIF